MRAHGQPSATIVMQFYSGKRCNFIPVLTQSFAAEAPDSWEKPNAHDWLFQPNHQQAVLNDLEKSGVNANEYPHLLNKIGQLYRPTEHGTENQEAGRRFLKILSGLNSSSFRLAHKGLSDWLAMWISFINEDRSLFAVWEAIWKASVAEYVPREKSETNVNGSSETSSEHWMITTPVWDLTRAFIAICPNLNDKKKPFRRGRLRNMRNVLDTAKGEVLEISNYLLLTSVSYFFAADENWTKQRLIPALQHGKFDTAWEALARANYLSPKVLSIIGDQLVEKSADDTLRRHVRNNFAARLIGDVMHAYREGNDTSIPANLVTRMLRKIDDEVRVHTAMQLCRFFRYWTGKDRHEKILERDVISPEDFWKRVIYPILEKVWPRDVHLITPGISDAFANLPVLSGECFSTAVEEINRYLLPFECWSLSDYGFGFQDKDELANVVTDSSKAEALLKLLDKTIGSEEEAVIPYDLSTALEHISKIDKKLSGKSSFKRLKAQLR